MFGFSRPQSIAFLFMLALIVVCPYVLYPVFLMRVLCMALFACAFNLMIGYVGLLSFGQAAFFGMGAYVSAWTMKVWHVDAMVAILFGGATGAALGLCLGYLAIRRSGIYFAMITLAAGADGLFLLALKRRRSPAARTASSRCLAGICSVFLILNNDMTMYFGSLRWCSIAGFLLVLPHHPLANGLPGRQVLKAIRENEPRASITGISGLSSYKAGFAFILSCMLSGRCRRAPRAIVFGIATLTDVQSATSGEVVLTTLLAGLGTVFGPVMGALCHGARQYGELPGAVRVVGDGDAGRWGSSWCACWRSGAG